MTTAPAPPAAEPTPPSSVVVLTQKERLAGVVQTVGRRPDDIPRRKWESLAVFVAFTVGYAVFGHWLVVDMHVISFETLDRLNRTLMVWHNEPAKLAAIGFDYPPLSTLLVSPLTLVPALARSLAVVPLASALFAGATMVVLNTMLRRAQVVAPLRVAVLVALGGNPLLALYAASGARHIIWVAFVVAALGALFAWYVTADVRFVMIAGLLYAVAALAGYSSLLWFVVSALMVGAILARLGADGTEVEGTTVGFAAPTVYVMAIWTAFNAILLTDPFGWITSRTDATGSVESFTMAELARYTGELVLYGAPIAILVLPALLFVGFRDSGFALWLAAMLLVAVVAPAASVALGLTDSPMLMRNALPVLLLSVVGAIWIARSSGQGATLVSALLVVGLLASIPWTFHGMKTYRYQLLEAPFANAVSTRESQEGARTVGGGSLGIVSEQAMADYLRANVSEESSVLTDNAQTYAVMLLTGDPALFFDRVDRSDGTWQEAAKDPDDHGVDFLLLSTDTDEDLLSQLYADAVDGTDPMLPEIFSTPRYKLVGVPSGYERGATTAPEQDPVTETGQGGAVQ